MITLKQQSVGRATLALAHIDFNKGLNAYAFYKMSSREMGEDMVQETFLRTWKYLLKGGKIDIMKAFLYHILNNLIIDEYRKRKTLSLDTLIDNGFEPSLGDTTERLINTLDGKVLIRLIPQLPILYGKVMHMRYVQELSISEMSLLTGQTKNVMSVQVHRGLEKLRVLYGDADVTI